MKKNLETYRMHLVIGWRPWIVSFSKSLSEDVWIFLLFFLCLSQDIEESTLYYPKCFRPCLTLLSKMNRLKWLKAIGVDICLFVVCVCVCVFLSLYIYICTCVCYIYIYIYIMCVCVSVCVCVYIRLFVYLRVLCVLFSTKFIKWNHAKT